MLVIFRNAIKSGKMPWLIFFAIYKTKTQKKGRKKNKWPLGEALVFSEIRHINYKKIS